MGEDNTSEQSVGQSAGDERQIHASEQSRIMNEDTRKHDGSFGHGAGHNENAANEYRTSDTSRTSNDRNKSSENGYNGNESNKRPKSICYDFKKGLCRRRFCRVSGIGREDTG